MRKRKSTKRRREGGGGVNCEPSLLIVFERLQFVLWINVLTAFVRADQKCSESPFDLCN